MKEFSSSSPSQSPRPEKDSSQKPGSSPKSALVRLCRKLSPRRSEKRTLSDTPNTPTCGKFQRVFRYFDEDGDGKISPSELQSCMKMIGEELSLQDAEAVFQSIDSDGDGLLDFDDFVRLIEARGEDEQSSDLREAFGMYEMDGSGYITAKSLKKMLGRLGESRTIGECRAMICRFDLNGDGVLSFEEFRIMMV